MADRWKLVNVADQKNVGFIGKGSAEAGECIHVAHGSFIEKKEHLLKPVELISLEAPALSIPAVAVNFQNPVDCGCWDLEIVGGKEFGPTIGGFAGGCDKRNEVGAMLFGKGFDESDCCMGRPGPWRSTENSEAE